jgi:hypothetical protein
MPPFVTVYLDAAGFGLAEEDAANLDKIIGRETSIGCRLPGGGGWINIETQDEDVIHQAEDHFAGHVVEIVRSWED